MCMCAGVGWGALVRRPPEGPSGGQMGNGRDRFFPRTLRAGAEEQPVVDQHWLIGQANGTRTGGGRAGRELGGEDLQRRLRVLARC